MTATSWTNVADEQPDIRFFALLTLWSELVGAVRHERRPQSDRSSVVHMDLWRTEDVARPTPAPLYRMITEAPAGFSDTSYAESMLLDDLTGDNIDASISGVVARDVKSALVRAVDELPPEERTVVSLYYFEGLTLRDIRGALNVTESRVSKIHAHAILSLRKNLSSLLDKFTHYEPESADGSDARLTNEALWRVVNRFHSISSAKESTAIRNGLSASMWNALELLGFARREIASVVGTSEKTIHRKIVTLDILAVAEGDRTMRLIRLMLSAIESFGDAEKAFIWLRRPNRALHGQPPLETMITESGADLVRRALGVIAYGGVA